MTRRYGIDTSVLVRLLTGNPPDTFSHCEKALRTLAKSGAEVFASNQVIGEAYVTVQHHYGVSSTDARAGLEVLTLDRKMAALSAARRL